MIDAKRKLLDLNSKHYLNESIEKSDFMVLINITWNKSFARSDKNRKAISDRGSEPYNRNILDFSLIRATMVESNYVKEMKYHFVVSPFHQ